MYQFISYKKVDKLFFIFLVLFVLFGTANSTERTKKEIKIGVFIEDFQKFGKFKKIDNTPAGMFSKNVNSFHQKQVIAQKMFIDTLLQEKGRWKKYDQVILGMAYFEFFYMQQLKDNKNL